MIRVIITVAIECRRDDGEKIKDVEEGENMVVVLVKRSKICLLQRKKDCIT